MEFILRLGDNFKTRAEIHLMMLKKSAESSFWNWVTLVGAIMMLAKFTL